MQIKLAFGKTGLDVTLPEGYDYKLLEARSAKPLSNPQQALADAIARPIASAPLAELARGKKTAAISVCDITRPAPNRLGLPHVLRALEEGGIPRDNVTVLIATGLHRPATDAEIREIIGPELYGQLRVVNHNARERSEHRYLGISSTGTPVYIDERFISADLHITLGFIEPHLMLGFSGGRKLIAPGLAAQETIKVLHSPKFMRQPLSVGTPIAHRSASGSLAMARSQPFSRANASTASMTPGSSGLGKGMPPKSGSGVNCDSTTAGSAIPAAARTRRKIGPPTP